MTGDAPAFRASISGESSSRLVVDGTRRAARRVHFDWQIAAAVAASSLPFGGGRRLERGEPAYPELWLRAWEHVLNAWPEAGPRPRVDVIPVGLKYNGPQGTYEPKRHAITLYPTVTQRASAEGMRLHRADALSTIIHEFAHAWAHRRRRSVAHGPSWRDTYAAIAGWVCGGVVNMESAIAKYTELRDAGDPFSVDLFERRRGADLKAAIADFAVTAIVHQNEPRVTMWDRDFKVITGDGVITQVVPYSR